MSRKIPLTKKTSKVWNYYTLENDTAVCNLCHTKISCKFVTNLRKHLLRKHGSIKLKRLSNISACHRVSKSHLLCKGNRKRTSIVWSFFIKKDKMVECNLCKQEFSFRALSSSNLKKHLWRIHPTVELNNNYTSSQTSNVTVEGLNINPERTSFENTCSFVNPLTTKNTELGTSASSWAIKNLNSKYMKSRKKTSAVWNFFHLENKIAECNLCKLKFSYRSFSPSNLKKHLLRKHPTVKLSKDGISLSKCNKVIEKGLNINSEQTSLENTCLSDTSLTIKNSEPGVPTSRGVINNLNNMNMKGRNKTSAVWNFFNLVNETAECDMCKLKMSYRSYSTSNLRNHLLKKHPTVELLEDSNNLGSHKRKMMGENFNSNISHTTSLNVYLTDVSEVIVSSELQTPNSCSASILNDKIKTIKKTSLVQLSKDNSRSEITGENLNNFVETPFVNVLSVDNSQNTISSEPETSISSLELDLDHRFKKNRNKTSILWNFFTLENETAICKLCEEKISYRLWSLSNLKKHMLCKHPTIEISKNVTITKITEEHFNDNSLKTPFTLLIDNSENTVNVEPVSSVFCSESNLDHEYQIKIPSSELSKDEERSDRTVNNFNDNCVEIPSIKATLVDNTEHGSALPLLNEKDNDLDRKNGTRFSKVWSFYTVENEVAICKLCKSSYSCKWVSSLRHHLMRRHSNDCVPDDINISVNCNSKFTDRNNCKNSVTAEPGVSASSVALALTHGKKRKTLKKTSIVWNFFTYKDSKTAECDFCKMTFSCNSSVSNLKKHLIRKHAIGVLVKDANISVNCESNITGENSISNTGQTKCINMYFTSNSNSVITEPLLHPALNVVLGTFSDEKSNKFLEIKLSLSTKKVIDNLVLDLLIYDFQPFTLLDDIVFRKSMKILSPSYSLPTKKTFINKLLPARYEKCYNNLKKALSETKISSVILTLDCWTLDDCSDRCLLAVICSFISENFHVESKLLECFLFSESDTVSNLAIKLENIAKGWGFENKILLCISDNASNVKLAVKEILNWNYFECFAHVINSIANDGLELHVYISSIIKKIKSVVQYFKTNVDSMKTLLDLQEQLGYAPKELLSDVPVTWSSTFCMLERFVELEVPICSALALIDVVLPGLDSREWKIAAEMVEVLRPLQEVTEMINGEDFLTASSVIIITKGMENAYKEMLDYPLLQETQELVETIVLSIQCHLGDLESNDTLLISTFLDPRFKTVGFSSANTAERAKMLVVNLMESEFKLGETDQEQTENITDNGIPAKKTPTVWNRFDKRVMEFKSRGVLHSQEKIEVQRYLEEPLLNRIEDPLKWWQDNSQKYPLLNRLFFKKFAALATSVPCEQLFSKTDIIPSDWRSRLLLEKVKELIFLFVNDQQERNLFSQKPLLSCL